jgi:hypothetical protein
MPIGLDAPHYLSPSLLHDVDKHLAEAVDAVEAGTASKATVTLTLSVEFDETEGLVGSFTLRGAATRKGDWTPHSRGQRRLLDEEDR